MTFLLPALGALILLRVLYSRLVKYREDRAFAAFAAANHCAPPPVQPNRLPYGIDRLITFLTFKGDLLDALVLTQYETHGWTHLFHGLSGAILNTADPANIQAILSLRFNDFALGPKRRDNFSALLGPEGIFTSDGPQWEHARAVMRPQFSREQVSDFEATERHVQNLFAAMPEGGGDGEGWTGEVNLMELFYRFTLDTATEFLFGQSTDSQLAALREEGNGVTSPAAAAAGADPYHHTRPSVPEASSTIFPAGGSPAEKEMGFAEALNHAQDFLAWRLRLPQFLWPLAPLPFSASRRKLNEAIAICHRFVDHYVDLALRTTAPASDGKQVPLQPSAEAAHPPNPPPTQQGHAGKKRYILLNELALSTRSPTELRSHVLHTLLAGRDTTASLLSWTLLLLPLHPAVLAKLRAEILAAFPPDPTNNYPGDITFAKLKGCRYLQHVLNEVLRLYPVVPMNFRVAVRDTVLPTGGGPRRDRPVAVRKGQIVPYPVYVLHRRKDLWGEDAREFRPERWAEGRGGGGEAGDGKGRVVGGGWEFLPFNGGPRVCLGQQFALAEASYVVVRLLQTFDRVEPGAKWGGGVKGLSVTMFPGKGVWVRMKRAAKV